MIFILNFMHKFKNKRIGNLDLTTTLEPPRDLYVQVTVTEDLGEAYLPETGVVNLKKNAR